MSGPDGLAFASIAEVAELIHTRAASCREITEHAVRRCEDWQSELNCFITFTPDRALERAQALDDLLASGVALGPLHGIPIVHKDNIATGQVRTTLASPLYADHVPDASAAVVRQLDRAGAVTIAKANLYELALGGVSPMYGDTRNPWDTTMTSGGSSSGSACAVAAGLAYGATGTDTGGSVRIPAAACGVVGLKPTYDLISREGVIPAGHDLDHVGVLARDVYGVAALLRGATAPGAAPREGARVEPLERDLRGVRLGVVREQPDEVIAPEVRVAFAEAVGVLRDAGAEIALVDLPDYALVWAAMSAIYAAQCAEAHRDRCRGRFSELSANVQAVLVLGAALPVSRYLRAQRVRSALAGELRELFRTVDVIALPTMPTVAWGPDAVSLRIDGVEQPLEAALRYSALFNLTGQPALSMPCGFSPAGLPLGLQLVGRPWEEKLLLEVAHAYEAATGWPARHPRRPVRTIAGGDT